ncbi:MAG: hypothetical protein JWM11_5617 [Planctomycetaceae bacterium]|nr:hypothetical protein [Planctomycetaceae bacterium]
MQFKRPFEIEASQFIAMTRRLCRTPGSLAGLIRGAALGNVGPTAIGRCYDTRQAGFTFRVISAESGPEISGPSLAGAVDRLRQFPGD